MSKQIFFVLLLSSTVYSAEQLQLQVTSLIEEDAPSNSQNSPGANGFAVGDVNFQSHELLTQFGLGDLTGFPGGVWVENVIWSTAIMCKPIWAMELYEITNSITENTSWNSIGGPSNKLPGILLVINDIAGQGCASFSKSQSINLINRLQQRINENKGVFRVALVGNRNAPDYTAMHFQNITVNAWLNGDADKDGDVDFSDFVTLSNNFETPGSWKDGDFTHDGWVDFADFVLLSSNYGLSL